MIGSRPIPGWMIATGLGVLVVGLVAVAMLRGPAELDPDSPEGTVQEYLMSLDDERWEDALGVLHPAWRGECQANDLMAMHVSEFTAELGTASSGSRDELIVTDFRSEAGENTEKEGTLPFGTRFIDVTIHHLGEGGLGSTWSEPVTFELVDEDDFWWIVGDPWPYFTWNCRDR